jgi:hypothetical protein
MEKLAVNSLVMISEQIFETTWQTPLNQEFEGKHFSSIHQNQGSSHFSYKKNITIKRKGNTTPQIMTSKLIAFKNPTKGVKGTQSDYLTNKKCFPSLPIKLSPEKHLNKLIEKNMVQEKTTSGYATINLSEFRSNSRKYRARHYT